MTPREIIARAVMHRSEREDIREADAILSALTAAGYSIIHDSENHGPTVERAAGIARSKYLGHGVEFGTARAGNYEHAGKFIASAIRAMTAGGRDAE